MKFYLKPVLSLFIMAILLGYSGCGPPSEPEPTEEEVKLEALSSTWKVGANGNVTLDGKPKKTDYSNFQLVITGTPGATSYQYTTSGRPALSPWPASGTWNFGNIISQDIIRDKGNASKEVPMTYTVTDTQLEITFNYQGAGEARTSEVKGTWIFTLTK